MPYMYYDERPFLNTTNNPGDHQAFYGGKFRVKNPIVGIPTGYYSMVWHVYVSMTIDGNISSDIPERYNSGNNNYQPIGTCNPNQELVASWETYLFRGFWYAKSYTLNFNGNGASNPASITVTYSYSFNFPSVSRTGYTFNGWSLMGGTYNGNTTWVWDVNNQTAYANWTPKTYTLNFNGSGASNPASITVTFNSTFSFPSVSRTGYTLFNWSLMNGTYNGNTTWVWDLNNQTAYANWTPNNYDVNFNSNGIGTGKIYSYQYNSSVTLVILRAIGYTFIGWDTSSTSKTAITSYTVPANSSTLYAVWNDNNYIKLSNFEITYVNSGYSGNTQISMSKYRTYLGISSGAAISFNDCKGKGPAPP